MDYVAYPWLLLYRYDFDTQYAFVGDYSGQITLLKLEQSSCSVITTLKGHEGRLCDHPQVFLLIWASRLSSQPCSLVNDPLFWPVSFSLIGQMWDLDLKDWKRSEDRVLSWVSCHQNPFQIAHGGNTFFLFAFLSYFQKVFENFL